MSAKNVGYFRLSNALPSDPRVAALSARELRLLLQATSYANTSGYCWASEQTLADDLSPTLKGGAGARRADRSWVSRGLKKLRDVGLLALHRCAGPRTSAVYRVATHVPPTAPVEATPALWAAPTDHAAAPAALQAANPVLQPHATKQEDNVKEKTTTPRIFPRHPRVVVFRASATAPGAAVAVPATPRQPAELAEKSRNALVAAKVAPPAAARLAQECTWERVEAVLDEAQRRGEMLENSPGWIVAKLENGWPVAPPRAKRSGAGAGKRGPAVTAGYAAAWRGAGAGTRSDAAPAPMPAVPEHEPGEFVALYARALAGRRHAAPAPVFAPAVPAGAAAAEFLGLLNQRRAAGAGGPAP